MRFNSHAWRISETADYIVDKGYNVVTLQLPDDLLPHATQLAGILKEECVSRGCSVQVYVLADTTYNSLSVDEVAAQHVGAQCVIHYGRASMTKLSRLPAYFVFPEEQLDVPAAACSLATSPSLAVCTKALVFMDQPLLSLQRQLQAELQFKLAGQNSRVELIFAEVPTRQLEPQHAQQQHEGSGAVGGHTSGSSPACCHSTLRGTAGEPSRAWHQPGSSCDPASAPAQHPCASSTGPPHAERAAVTHRAQPCCGSSPANIQGAAHGMTAPSASPPQHPPPGSQLTGPVNGGTHEAPGGVQSLGGYVWEPPVGLDPAEFCFVWVGADDAPALVQLQMTHSNATWVVCDPQRGCREGLPAHISRALRRRYYLVEKARVANVVGVLVGTLGVAGYRDAMQRVRQAAHQAGKKTYTLLMGKPSPAKLANFPEIEVFVMIADPQGQILDSKEFLSPIITPYEAMLAFSSDSQWDASQYRLDFDEVVSSSLPQGVQEQGAEVHHSLVNGWLHSNPQKAFPVDGDSALSLRAQDALQITSAPSGRSDVVEIRSAADYYVHRRTWLGVETPLIGSEPKAAEKAAAGRTGRAAGYVDEPPHSRE